MSWQDMKLVLKQGCKEAGGKTGGNMKRLCIYLTYDEQKQVDGYVGYMLKELKTCVSALVVVCNARYITKGENILREYADEIYYRENKGFDAGGFKDALCGYIGWQRVLSFDEVVLVNDSMFGPFRSMESIFQEMDRKALDFWGLGKSKDNFFLEHIQTYFLTIRSKMLHDCRFKEYWEAMPYYDTLGEVVNKYEVKFTEYFSSFGYKYDVLGDMESNYSEINPGNHYLQYGAIQYELIKKRNFPFLKRRPIVFDNLYQQTQENLRQAIDYIDKCTEYDVNLIWDNIIRTFNMADLQRSLHLQYILPEHSNGIKTGKKAVFAVFISCPISEELVWEYIRELIQNYDVKVYSEEENLLESYQRRKLDCYQYHKNNILNLLLELCEYDLVCVLHDTDVTSDKEPSCVGKSYFYNVWENLVKSKEYASSIIQKFEDEPRLGFLSNPQPFFSRYFDDYSRGWNQKFEKVSQVAEEIKLRCIMSEDKPPFRITENFWIRGFLLKRLKDMKAEDYSCLQYMWTYIAQDAGFFSGIAESLDYASMNEVNLDYYLKQLAVQNRRYNGEYKNFIDMKEQVTQKELISFLREYPRIFVYGAGYYADKYRKLLGDIEGFIVSDGQSKPDNLDGITVKYLSEVELNENCGIAVCLSEEKQIQVISALEEKGIKNYFCI